MDKSCSSFGDSPAAAAAAASASASASGSSGSYSNSKDQYLKQLNKYSHKIYKPTAATAGVAVAVRKPGFEPQSNLPHQATPPAPLNQSNNQGNIHQHQPPVYNINKNDFRDVVQRLTGSPAHERISTASPTHQPKPQNSRLQRIRPPPLAHVGNRPSPILNGPVIPPNYMNPNPCLAVGAAPGFIPRPTAPLSPLPPLPPVHAAAESPVSAYMRCLQSTISTSDSNPKQFSGFSPLAPLLSSRWDQTNPPPQQQQENAPPPNIRPPTAPQQQGILPLAPSPFGCLNSPRSPYPLLSPTSGQLGFPLSPTVPVPSPRFKGL